MEFNIKDKNESKLLLRKEIAAEMSFQGPTPSAEDVKKKVSELEKADEKLIVVKNISTKFGSTSATAEVYIYSTKEDMERAEPKKKEKKDKKPGEAPAEGGEKPAESKPEEKKEESKEAPAEEKKEDKPAEEKKE